MKPGEVLAMHFPTMKPLDTPKSEKKPEEVGIIGGAKGTVEIEIKDERSSRCSRIRSILTPSLRVISVP